MAAMETDRSSVGAPDKFFDLESELQTCDSLLFTREDYPISELLFDTTDNELDDDMFHSSVLDAASTEVDGASRMGSNTTTPPFRPSVAHSSPPHANTQPPPQVVLFNEVKYEARSTQPYEGGVHYATSDTRRQERANNHAYPYADYTRLTLPEYGSTMPLPGTADARTAQRTLPRVPYSAASLEMANTAASALAGTLQQALKAEPMEPPIVHTGATSTSATRREMQWPFESAMRVSSAQSRSLRAAGPSTGRVQSSRYVCKICAKSFKRGHNLKIHQRLHTGDHPYACPFSGCSKEYKWKSSIVSHIGWHRTKRGESVSGYNTVSSLVKLGKEMKQQRLRAEPLRAVALGDLARLQYHNAHDSALVSAPSTAASGVIENVPRLQPLRGAASRTTTYFTQNNNTCTVNQLPSFSSLRLAARAQASSQAGVAPTQERWRYLTQADTSSTHNRAGATSGGAYATGNYVRRERCMTTRWTRGVGPMSEALEEFGGGGGGGGGVTTTGGMGGATEDAGVDEGDATQACWGGGSWWTTPNASSGAGDDGDAASTRALYDRLER